MGDLGAAMGQWEARVSGGAQSKVPAAARLLGVPDDDLMTEDSVRAAYRVAVKANHPDTGTGTASMADLQSARDVLLAELAKAGGAVKQIQKRNCFFCGGSGMVTTGFTAELCSACGGTGVAK